MASQTDARVMPDGCPRISQGPWLPDGCQSEPWHGIISNLASLEVRPAVLNTLQSGQRPPLLAHPCGVASSWPAVAAIWGTTHHPAGSRIMRHGPGTNIPTMLPLLLSLLLL